MNSNGRSSLETMLLSLTADDRDLLEELLVSDGLPVFLKHVLPEVLKGFEQAVLTCSMDELAEVRARYDGARQLTTRLSRIKEELKKTSKT